MALRITPIHRAGHRENLLLGADRRLLFCAAIGCVLLFFALFTLFAPLAFIVPPLVWMTSLKLLRKAAAADPHLRTVYWRYVRQANFYPARSTPHRLRRLPKDTSWT